VQVRAAKLAKDAWGVGPLSGGSHKEDDSEKLAERIAKGDINAYLEATFMPPPASRK